MVAGFENLNINQPPPANPPIARQRRRDPQTARVIEFLAVNYVGQEFMITDIVNEMAYGIYFIAKLFFSLIDMLLEANAPSASTIRNAVQELIEYGLVETTNRRRAERRRGRPPIIYRYLDPAIQLEAVIVVNDNHIQYFDRCRA